jgi:uncharacterized protein DUF6894
MATTYYFDFRTGDVLSQDEEGAELPDLEAAHKVALQAIAEAVQDGSYRTFQIGLFWWRFGTNSGRCSR